MKFALTDFWFRNWSMWSSGTATCPFRVLYMKTSQLICHQSSKVPIFGHRNTLIYLTDDVEGQWPMALKIQYNDVRLMLYITTLHRVMRSYQQLRFREVLRTKAKVFRTHDLMVVHVTPLPWARLKVGHPTMNLWCAPLPCGFQWLGLRMWYRVDDTRDGRLGDVHYLWMGGAVEC